MASAAGANIWVLLLASLLMGTAAGGDHGGGKDDGFIRRVDELPVPVPGSCLCYDRCSNGSGLTDAASQTCFVHCVLRLGCVCSGGGGGGAHGDPKNSDDGAPPATQGLPALLDRTVRVNVARQPKVSRSRGGEEEVLVVEVTFDDDDPPKFSVHVNAPEGGEEEEFRRGTNLGIGRPTPTMEEKERGIRKKVLRFPMSDKLEMIGADGDEVVVVSFWPIKFDYPSVDWYKEHRITISAVRIEYGHNNS